MMYPQYSILAQPSPNRVFFGMPYGHIRVDEGQEEAEIEGMLDSAVQWIETHTNRVLRVTSFTGRFPCFDFAPDRGQNRAYIEIRKSPLVDVQEVRVREVGEAAAVTIASTIDIDPCYSRVFMPKGRVFDLDYDNFDLPIEIDFRAGYASDVSDPAVLLSLPTTNQAVKAYVAHLFANRGDVGDETDDSIPEQVRRLCEPIRILPGYP